MHFPQGVFMTSKLYTEPGHAPTASVHLGDHHGMAGLLLVLTALLLSRPHLRGSRTRAVFAALLSLMLVYGLANMANDFWHEQVVKRGWASFDLPSALQPGVRPIWAVMLAAAVVLYALGFARGMDER